MHIGQACGWPGHVGSIAERWMAASMESPWPLAGCPAPPRRAPTASRLARRTPARDIQLVPPLQTRIVAVLQLREWALRGRLFAVVDATGTPSVPARARALSEERAVSLYRGRAEEDLWSIAPYLFQVDEATLGWISESLWSQPWGIFLLADESLEDLRLHLRRFLLVEGPAGESWYFRFYDPRVLGTFLDSCTPEELAAFTGPIRAFGATDPVSYGVQIYGMAGLTIPAGAKAQPLIVRRQAS
jgi:hypothetical protein